MSVKTLQRWDNDGKLTAYRNPSNSYIAKNQELYEQLFKGESKFLRFKKKNK